MLGCANSNLEKQIEYESNNDYIKSNTFCIVLHFYILPFTKFYFKHSEISTNNERRPERYAPR